MKRVGPIRVLKSKDKKDYIILKGKRVLLNDIPPSLLKKATALKYYQKGTRRPKRGRNLIKREFLNRVKKYKEAPKAKRQIVQKLHDQIVSYSHELSSLKNEKSKEDLNKKIKDLKAIEDKIKKADILKLDKLPELNKNDYEIFSLVDRDTGQKEDFLVLKEKAGEFGQLWDYIINKQVSTELQKYVDRMNEQRRPSEDEVLIREEINDVQRDMSRNNAEVDELLERMRNNDQQQAIDFSQNMGEGVNNPRELKYSSNEDRNNDGILDIGLYGWEVNEMCQNLPGFLGTFDSKTIKNVVPHMPIFSLIYLVERPKPQPNHWIAIFGDFIEKETDYFNSLGEPAPAKIENFFAKLYDKYEVPFAMTWKNNHIRMQGDSPNCGIYSAYFLWERSFAISFKDATNFTNIKKNEQQMMRARINWGFV